MGDSRQKIVPLRPVTFAELRHMVACARFDDAAKLLRLPGISCGAEERGPRPGGTGLKG
jgi:hypothetical protein